MLSKTVALLRSSHMGEPSRAWDTFLRIYAAVSTAALISGTVFMLNLDDRVLIIEANRFTARDGHSLEELIVKDREITNKSLGVIMTTLEVIRARMPGEFPPEVFVRRVENLEKRIHALELKK